MNYKQIIKHLLYLFDGSHYAEMFEVIDEKSGIRGAGMRFTKIKDYPNGDEDYKVTINKNILEKWLGGEE
jgi:hypothetical protein